MSLTINNLKEKLFISLQYEGELIVHPQHNTLIWLPLGYIRCYHTLFQKNRLNFFWICRIYVPRINTNTRNGFLSLHQHCVYIPYISCLPLEEYFSPHLCSCRRSPRVTQTQGIHPLSVSHTNPSQTSTTPGSENPNIAITELSSFLSH